MITFINSFKETRNSNLVFLAQNTKDLDLLSGLKLDKKIIDKIKKAITKKENTLLQFFL
ncbi:MAG: hypothetical protein LBF15_06080 [Candidatus Peribacteria bacterium]|jgi:hypothetical protein|nr:hypothetical protein [Candidatus Peribacteria bacterium]